MLAQLVVTFGISIFLSNLAVTCGPGFRLIPTTSFRGHGNIGGISISIPKAIASIGSIVTSLCLFLFMKKTKTGKQSWRQK